MPTLDQNYIERLLCNIADVAHYTGPAFKELKRRVEYMDHTPSVPEMMAALTTVQWSETEESLIQSAQELRCQLDRMLAAAR